MDRAQLRTVAVLFFGAGGLGVLPGCLLGRTVDFNDGGLPPLTPPAILDEESTPTPHTMVVVTAPAGSDRASVTFRLRVAESNPSEAVRARWFLRRPRQCSEDVEASCPPAKWQSVDLGSAPVRTLEYTAMISRLPNICQWIDVYVTSGWVPMFEQQYSLAHLPARQGDVASARWYVWVREASNPTERPDWSRCPVVCDGPNCREMP